MSWVKSSLFFGFKKARAQDMSSQMQDLHVQPRIIPPAPVTCPALLAVFLMEFAAVTILFAWLVLPLGFVVQKVGSLPWLIVLLSASPTWQTIHESLRNLHLIVCSPFH